MRRFGFLIIFLVQELAMLLLTYQVEELEKRKILLMRRQEEI
jgi:hypothetical protein